jgi:hypothetical protein
MEHLLSFPWAVLHIFFLTVEKLQRDANIFSGANTYLDFATENAGLGRKGTVF